jgi:hypothetical protein
VVKLCFILVILQVSRTPIRTLKIPTQYMKVPLHDQRVGVWCAVHGQKIIGAIFLYNTVNLEHYVNGILEPSFQMLTEKGSNVHISSGVM